jgi:hypothetical protein
MKQIAYLFITLLTHSFLGSQWNSLKAQGSYESDSEFNSSSEYDDHDKAIFDNDPVFENYSFFEDRGSNDDVATLDGTFEGNGPIDGGITWVVGGLVGYGLSRIRRSKRTNNNELQS